jgi:hypothetical protein
MELLLIARIRWGLTRITTGTWEQALLDFASLAVIMDHRENIQLLDVVLAHNSSHEDRDGEAFSF